MIVNLEDEVIETTASTPVATCGCTESLYRMDHLHAIPAFIKFVSAEPLLERMNFRPYLLWLNWIITGCERAAKEKRRIMEIEWVRDINAQCKEAKVAHFFKQAYVDGRGVPCEEPLLDEKVVQEFPDIRPTLQQPACNT